MKTPRKILFIFLLTTFAFYSCDYTDIDPSDFNSDPFRDLQGVEGTVNGAYSLMDLRITLSLAEYIADDVKQGGQAGGAGTDSYAWSYSAGTGDHNGFWTKQYQIINLANRIIAYGKDTPVGNEAEQKQLNDYLGSAYFIRAYAHFDLLRFFSNFKNEDVLGIPYVSNPHVLGQPARDKVGDCYDYVMKDLDRAFNLLENVTPKNTAYASKAAVNALRARVSLYRGKYLHAYVYSTDAQRGIAQASAEDYPLVWADKSNAGIILKLPRSAGQSRIGGLFIGQDNSHVFGPSNSYIGIYDNNDIRKNVFFGKGPDREGDEVNIIKKYIGTPDNIGLNHEKLLRVEEMKLIEIESLIFQDRLSDANDQLNKFRASRIKNWGNKSYDKAALIEEILLERRRELAFEGHRFFDLRRHAKNIVRDNGSTLAADDYRQLMPIPQAEMEANSNIPKSDQNPGY